MNALANSYAVVGVVGMLLCSICEGNPSTNSMSPEAWNDDVEEIWDSSWGGAGSP